MLASVKHAAGEAARKVTLVGVALVCLTAAAGFLTSAAWIALTDAHGAVVAGSVIGAAYTAIGIVLLLIAKSDAASRPVAAPPPPPPLTQAFMTGLLAGMQRKA